MRFSLFVLCWLLSWGTACAAPLDYTVFSHLPVQHEGRIKPLNSVAAITLERLRGSNHIGDMTAIAWLAQAMFDPSAALEAPVFLVKDTEVQAMLSLPVKEGNLYSFTEITHAIAASQQLVLSLLKRPADELSPAQKAVLKLHGNTGIFSQIVFSSTLFLKLATDVPPDMLARAGYDGKTPPPTAFIDYYPYMPALQNTLAAIVKRKGSDPAAYTQDEFQLALAMQRLSITMNSTQQNSMLRIMPPQWPGDEAWLSPWAVFHAGRGSPQSAQLMEIWRTLANAYQAHDATRWLDASHALRHQSDSFPGVDPAALSLEVAYYRYNPLGKTLALYLAGFILTLACLSGRARLYSFAKAVTMSGAVLHALSIGMRMYILQRPPVGTLYESLLFVSLIGVLFSLYLERRQRNRLGLLLATLAGSVLLFLSQSFGGDDTMSMLIAVLNTNFWLATHVLCITSGYGFGLIAGSMAHIHLIMLCQNRDADRTRAILRNAYATALIALLFSSLGTILGGIWADQSWGRFWGWDPKENGALMICLWLIWLLHGRISGRMHELGFSVGLSLLNIVIALSWLGVNLLSVGLHSYGFTDQAALGLGAFCAAECAFAAITYIIIKRKSYAS